MIEIIKSKIARTQPQESEQLNPTKAALYGIWVRLNDIDARQKIRDNRGQDACKIETFMNSRTDSNIRYSKEGIHKHKMPIPLDQFIKQQRASSLRHSIEPRKTKASPIKDSVSVISKIMGKAESSVNLLN